jgi:hypothetical protein
MHCNIGFTVRRGGKMFWLILAVYLQGTDSKLAVPFPPIGPYSSSEDCYGEAASFAAEIQEKNSKLNVTVVCGVEKNTEQKS